MNRTHWWSALLAVLIVSAHGEFCQAQLSLSVDSFTGGIQLVNSPEFSDGPISFDYYQIQSASGALNPSGWFSLSDQGIDAWAVAGAPTETMLAEAKLAGGTELAIGQSISLGNAFNPGVGIQDLVFEYAVAGAPPQLISGPVKYLGDPFPPGIPADYNADGIVSHADYSVLGDNYGQDVQLPNRLVTGPVGAADFEAYRANYGSIIAAASPVSFASTPGILPFSVASSTTAEGNTQWVISFSAVQSALAGHLLINSSGGSVLSATGGASFQDNGVPPVGVPGAFSIGGLLEGIIVNGKNVHAALGSTLGAASPGPNRQFLTLVTQGTTPTALTIQGEYGFQGVDYFVNRLASSAPGASPDDPILPTGTNPGEFIFTNVPSGAWVDPPLVDSFEYVMDSASLFTAILDFPPGFAAEFVVTAENTLLGEFGPGESANFVALLGHGVDRFVVSNITPLADAADPNAFPLKLEFDTSIASFRMLAVPEPGTLLLVCLGAVAMLLRRHW